MTGSKSTVQYARRRGSVLSHERDAGSLATIQDNERSSLLSIIEQAELHVQHWRIVRASQNGEPVVSKLVIMGTVEVAPEKRDQVLPLLMAHRARCLKDEPGTLQFEVVLPRDDHSRILIYEVYKDDAAFEAHRNAPSRAQWQEETAGMGVKVLATKCTPVE
jgi:(4S)-4-hydroxy-5-phosphonooxypentane-2,3-dione isomerase